MKARDLIEKAAYGPDQLKVLFKAFDDAWESVAADVGDREDAIEANRLRLANLILSLTHDGANDAAWLTATALRIMRATLGKE